MNGNWWETCNMTANNRRIMEWALKDLAVSQWKLRHFIMSARLNRYYQEHK